MRAQGPGYGPGSEGMGAAPRLYFGLLDPVPVGLPHPGHHRIASVATHLKHTSPRTCGVRPGGHVGAIEWYPQFCLSTSDPAHEAQLNAMFRRICNDYTVAANLARHFRAARLHDVARRTRVTLADSLDDHPFWRHA